MMTALIKMGQIEKGRVTMELCNDLPAGLCAHTGLSPRQIERREEGGAKERKAEERKETRREETRREAMESRNEETRVDGYDEKMRGKTEVNVFQLAVAGEKKDDI